MVNYHEVLSVLSVPRYAPILRPIPPPEKRWDECPTVCVEINQNWAGRIIGVLEVLDQPDAWLGDEETVNDLREQVRQLRLALMGDDMSCCCPEPTNTRITENGSYEVSYDGGVTWVDGKQFDPRGNTPLLPPLTGGEGFDARCEAAQNVSSHVKAAADQLIADLGTGVSIGGLVAAIFALLLFLEVLTLGAISPLLIGLAVALLQAGDSAFSAAMTADVYYTFQCIIYCHLDGTGRLNDGAIDSILSDINSQLTGVAAKYLYEWVKINGETGINNMAATDDGVAGDSCEDCVECLTCAQQFRLETAVFGGGVIVSRDETSVTVRSTDVGGGRHQICIWTGGVDRGCSISSAEVVDGAFTDFLDGVLVGNALSSGNIVFNVGAACINTFITWHDGGDDFTLKLTFNDC